jgi:hypothetical protein
MDSDDYSLGRKVSRLTIERKADIENLIVDGRLDDRSSEGSVHMNK